MVDFVLEMIENFGGFEIVLVKCLPRVDWLERLVTVISRIDESWRTTYPAALLDCQVAHVDSVLSLDQTALLVCISDSTHVGTNDLEIGVESGIVGGHFEHSQMKEGDGAERTACNQHEGCPGRILHVGLQALGRENILLHGDGADGCCGHRDDSSKGMKVTRVTQDRPQSAIEIFFLGRRERMKAVAKERVRLSGKVGGVGKTSPKSVGRNAKLRSAQRQRSSSSGRQCGGKRVAWSIAMSWIVVC